MVHVPNFARENELISAGFSRIAGVDEAGRGPLAGPVVAGAVVLPTDFSSPHFHQLNDSKQLPSDLRETLREEICARAAWGIGICDATEIDEINIRQASWQAMQRAVADLTARFFAPDYVLIDGLPYGDGPWPYEAIVKGDAKSLSIAAASVLAKVTRDRLMTEYDAQFPDYGFARHKGYPTARHLKALDERGVCALHRRSFGPVRKRLDNFAI